MADSSKCRRCNAPIYWHKSRAGKSYPCNSQDRRDFHQCSGTALVKAPAATVPQPLEATPEERLTALESTVAGLVRQVKQLGARLPITDEDIPW